MSTPSGAPRWPVGRVVGGLLVLALVTGGAVLASRSAGPVDARDASAPAAPTAPSAAPAAPPAAEVVNAGFDAQPLPDGALALGSPTGWSGAVVLLNPDGTQYSALAGGRARTGSMDGSNVLSLLGLLGREAVQTTPTVALPGVSYTLTVAVGGRDRGTFAGVTVALLAGGVPVRAQEVSRPPVRGGFGDVTLSWTAGQAEAGRRLGIRLGLTREPDAATGAGKGAGQDAGYADLDHVRLSATGTGRPATGLAVTAPVERQVLQRGPDGLAAVPVRVLAPPGGRAQARLVPRAGARGRGTGWAGLPAGPGGTGERVEGVLPGVPAGWYDLQVRLLDAAGAEIAGRTVQRVGVGEVFVTAGQSNAANHGIRPQTPVSDRVSAPPSGTAAGGTPPTRSRTPPGCSARPGPRSATGWRRTPGPGRRRRGRLRQHPGRPVAARRHALLPAPAGPGRARTARPARRALGTRASRTPPPAPRPPATSPGSPRWSPPPAGTPGSPCRGGSPPLPRCRPSGRAARRRSGPPRSGPGRPCRGPSPGRTPTATGPPG